MFKGSITANCLASLTSILSILVFVLYNSTDAAIFTVGNGPMANFTTLPQAWNYAVTNRQNATLQLLPGVHILPVINSTTVAVTDKGPPIFITHTPALGYNWPITGAFGNLSSFSNVTIAPEDTTDAGSIPGTQILIEGYVSISFQGIQFLSFPVSKQDPSQWSLFELTGNATLSFNDVLIRDNGLPSTAFSISAYDTTLISLLRVGIAGEEDLSLDLNVNDNASLRIEQSSFTNLNALRDSLVSAFSSSKVNVIDCTFGGNFNMAFIMRDAVQAAFTRSLFTRNTSPTISGQATVITVFGATVEFRSCKFIENSGGQTGVLSFTNTLVQLRNTEINGNRGTAIMCIRCAGSSIVQLFQCTISNHSGIQRLFQISETAQVTISDSVIERNYRGWIAGTYVSSTIRVQNTIIKDNTFAGPSPFYVGPGLQATFSRVVFLNNKANTYLVVADRSSLLFVTRCQFIGNIIQSGGAIQSYGELLAITNSTFRENSVTSLSQNDRLIYAMGTVTDADFTIVDSTFEKNLAAQIVSFSNPDSSSTVHNCTFLSNNGTIVMGTDDVAISIISSTFYNNFGSPDGSTLYSRGSLTLTNSTFTKNTGALKGSAVLYYPASPSISSLNIRASIFRENVALQDGGAIFISNAPNPTTMNIVGNKFELNEAMRGGAVYIFSASQVISFQENTFVLNVATSGQGANIASQPTRLESRSIDPLSNQTVDISYVSINSGDSLPDVRVVPVDQYGQVVHSLPDEIFLLHYQVLKELNDSNGLPQTKAKAYLEGDLYKAIIMDTGVAFQGVGMIGVPGTYSVAIMSGTDRFPSGIFNITSTINLLPCVPPKIEKTHSLSQSSLPEIEASNLDNAISGLVVCVTPVCTQGCILGQGVCVSTDVCQCAEGYEGIDCSLRKLFNDALVLSYKIEEFNQHVLQQDGDENVVPSRQASTSTGSFADPIVGKTINEIPLVKTHLRSKRTTSLWSGTAAIIMYGTLKSEVVNQIISLWPKDALYSLIVRHVDISKEAGIVNVTVSFQNIQGQFVEMDKLENLKQTVISNLAKQTTIDVSVQLPDPVNISQLVETSLSLKWTDSVSMLLSSKFHISFNSTFGILSMTLFAVFTTMTLITVAILTKYRSTPVVRSSSFFFGILICIGVILGFLLIPLSLGIPTCATCMAQAWVTALSFAMILGNLMTKTLRIMFIFGRASKSRLVSLADQDMLRYTGLVLVMEITLMLVWTFCDPPVPLIVDSISTGERYWACGANPSGQTNGPVIVALVLAFNVALLGFSVFLAVRTRGAQSAFRESKSIGMTVYTIFLVAGTCIPLLLLPRTGPLLSFGLKVGAVCLVNLTVLCLLFYPKIRIAVFRPDINNLEALNNYASKFPKQGASGSTSTKKDQTVSRKVPGEAIVAKQAFQARQLSRHGVSFMESVQRSALMDEQTTLSLTKTQNQNKPIQSGKPSNPISLEIVNPSITEGDIRLKIASANVRTRYGSIDQELNQKLDDVDVYASSGTVVGSTDGIMSNKTSSTKASQQAGAALIPVSEQVNYELDQLPYEPQKELFQVRFLSVRGRSFVQRWVQLYPLTDHLVISVAPVPIEATVLYLNQCKVRDLSAVIHNCLEIQGHGKTYWLLTRQDNIFKQWISWLSQVCKQNVQAVDYDEGEDLYESNDLTIAGSAQNVRRDHLHMP